MAAKLVYETVTCSRCGGSGTYSYCQMYGSTCFKCGGRKKTASKAGAKAAAAIKAFIADNFSVLVEDLKPGDRIRLSGSKRAATVATVETSGCARYGVNGEWKDYVTVTFTDPVNTGGPLGPIGTHGFIPGTKVTKAVNGADWDMVIAFARTIKKGVTVVESAAKVAS